MARLRPTVLTFFVKYWPEVVAVAAPLIVFWQITIGGQVLYWGLPSLQFVPWRVLVNQAFAQGQLPLWTPLLGMGAPLLANYQSAPFYPPNLLASVLNPALAISWLAVLHLSLGGLGLVRLARHLGLNQFGVAVAGLAFGLSGYLTGRMWFITINNAVVWLPWVVLLAPPGWGQRYGLLRFTGLVAVIALQLLSGHAQSAFYTLALAGVWMVWRVLWIRPDGARPRQLFRSLLINLALFGLAVFFAVAISALQLIPTYELLSQSPRASSADYDFVATYSLWPWRLLTFFAPSLFGHPADHNYFGYATFWEDNAYIGLLPLLFALYAFYQGIRLAWQRWRQASNRLGSLESTLIGQYVPLLVVLAFVSLLLAFGKNTPIFPFFYRFVPGFNLFQAPARMLIWYTFAISLLAGVGAHLWQASERKRYWARLSIAGSLAIVLLCVVGTYTLTNARAIVIGAGLAWAAAIGAVAFILLLLQGEGGWWRWAVIALITLDLGWAGLRATPLTTQAFYKRTPAFTQNNGRLFEFAADEYRVKFVDLLPFNSFEPLNSQAYRDSLLTNLNVLSNLPSANNFDPLLPSRYMQYRALMETNPKLLDLADVSALVKPDYTVSERPEPVQRWRVVYHAQPVSTPAQALALVSQPTFDPDQTVILETPPASATRYGLALQTNTTTQTVTLDQSGYVVLSDTYYPGWRVRVDGQEQPLLIADLNFKAVAVPAGTHTVSFDYAPFSVTLGLVVSAIASVLWLALVVWAWRSSAKGISV